MDNVRRCSECGETKSLVEFSPDKRARDGRQAACKPCQCIRAKRSREKPGARERRRAWRQQPRVKEWDRQYAQREYVKTRARENAKTPGAVASRRKYRLTEKSKRALREWKRRYDAAHPEKSAAHSKVAHALKRGVLSKRPCEKCGDPRSEAHHDDYSKPLDVRWLCRPCHMEHHRLEKLTG